MEIFTTMITPFHADGSVDYETAEKYVDWYFENGLTGIFAVCQSSEIFYLSLEEKVLQVLSTASFVDEYTKIVVEASANTEFSYAEVLGFSVYREKSYGSNKHIFLEKRQL